MQLLIAVAGQPFVEDPRSRVAMELAHCARSAGHEVDLLTIPYDGEFAASLEQIIAIRLMDLHDRGDRLLAVGPEACLLHHRWKACWLSGEDSLDAGLSASLTPACRAYREAERHALLTAVREARAVFCPSGSTAERLRVSWGIHCVGIDPPAEHPEVPPHLILKAMLS